LAGRAGRRPCSNVLGGGPRPDERDAFDGPSLPAGCSLRADARHALLGSTWLKCGEDFDLKPIGASPREDLIAILGTKEA
jgi:hypothetical protein